MAQEKRKHVETDQEVESEEKPKTKLRKPQAPVKKSRKKQKKEEKIAKIREEAFNKYKSGAVEYLTTWKTSKDEWKFSKNTQNWIISHIYNKELITDDVWDTALEYFQPSPATVKNKLLENAVKIIEENDEEHPNLKRAKDIVQIISE